MTKRDILRAVLANGFHTTTIQSFHKTSPYALFQVLCRHTIEIEVIIPLNIQSRTLTKELAAFD